MVIGTAKVMKYEDLKRVREERAAKAKAAADKAKAAGDKAEEKRDRKRKATARGDCDDDAQEADTSVPVVKNKRARRTMAQGPQPKPWRASVAPMYPGAM